MRPSLMIAGIVGLIYLSVPGDYQGPLASILFLVLGVTIVTLAILKEAMTGVAYFRSGQVSKSGKPGTYWTLLVAHILMASGLIVLSLMALSGYRAD